MIKKIKSNNLLAHSSYKVKHHTEHSIPRGFATALLFDEETSIIATDNGLDWMRRATATSGGAKFTIEHEIHKTFFN